MKRLIITFVSIIALLVNAQNLQAQYYLSGQDPASTKWKQINSENFQVIYPIGYDSMAQYVINVMEYGKTLTIKNRLASPPKMSVILHNQTIVSNAEVAWAPSRIEFYTTPSQDSYSQEWFQQLAIHEYVHVLQISAMNDGLTGFLYNIFGEQITVGIFGLYIPYWFIEGDAVVTETALSKAGRGRDPNFEMELRAQLLEKGAYSLEKASLGSYKDFTTDRYHLGYYLVGQGRVKYGKTMWNKPLSNTGRYPLAVVPFATGIKTKTKLSKNNFYKESLQDLSKEWSKQLARTNPEELKTISKAKGYTDYTQNSILSDGSILSLKKDFHEVGKLVRIDENGTEKLLIKPGYYQSDRMSSGGDYVCWSERQYDARWTYRTHSQLMLLNYKTGKKRKLVKKARYFSPQLSSSGKQLAVVESDELGQNYLVVLNTENGDVIQRLNSPDNLFLAHPSWSDDEKKIVVTATGVYGKTLLIFNLETENTVQLLPYQSMHILNPQLWKKFVLYEASYNGVMNIYAMDVATKSIYQITNVAFGAGDFVVDADQKELIFSNYTSDGKEIVSQEWNPNSWIPIAAVEDHRYPLADMLSEQVDTLMNPDFIPNEKYEAKKYSKLGHLFNVHSWNLVNLDADNGSLNPGVSVLSQNKLSTLSARVGADYSYNSEELRYYAQVDYLGWYPAFSFGVDYGGKFEDITVGLDTTRYKWMETNINAAVYLPLLYTTGSWVHNVQPRVGYEYKKISDSDLTFTYPNTQSVDYSFQYSVQQKSPWQNIYPRWGLATSFAFRDTPFDNDMGTMMLAGASIYLPGIFRHDGIRLIANYQDKEGKAGFYSDWADPARGYSDLDYNDMLTFRADYSLPLIYPDFNIASLAYIKRVQLGLFYDYSQQTDVTLENAYHHKNDFWSTGVDLIFDVHFLRSKFPFQLGLRSIYVDGYVKNPEAMVYQFIWGVSI